MATRRQRVIASVRTMFRETLAVTVLASMLGAAAAADAPTLSAELLKPGLYRIGGTVVRSGASGQIIVDPPRAETHRSLIAEIARLPKSAEKPARALVLTAVGTEPSSSPASPFIDAGVPVAVQRRALGRFASGLPAGAEPSRRAVVAYDTDYMLRTGDVEAEVEHVGSGRTGADSVVNFRDLRVVAVGGLFTAGTPRPDCASGGSYAGWAAAITHLLWLDFDVAVPSHGAPVGKRELLALKATLEALAARQAGSTPGASDCRLPAE